MGMKKPVLELEKSKVDGDVEGGVILLYMFYKKPMASRYSMLARSAQPEKIKVSTAVAEFKRRCKTSSTFLPASTVEKITQDYPDELAGMGFSETWRANAIEACLRGYNRIQEQVTPRNRPGVSSQVARRVKKLIGKSTWFQRKMEQRAKQQSVKFRRHPKPKSQSNQ